MNSPVAVMLAAALIGSGGATAATQALPPPWLPADPGKAQCRLDARGAELSDGALRFVVRTDGKSIRPALLENRFTHDEQALEGELFAIAPRVARSARGGKQVGASQFELTGRLSCVAVEARDGVARAAERRNGFALTGTFKDRTTGVQVAWRAVLRDGANYVREEAVLTAAAASDLASVTLIDLKLENAWIAGTADGSPLIAGDLFFGFEHPMAYAQIEAATPPRS